MLVCYIDSHCSSPLFISRNLLRQSRIRKVDLAEGNRSDLRTSDREQPHRILNDQSIGVSSAFVSAGAAGSAYPIPGLRPTPKPPQFTIQWNLNLNSDRNHDSLQNPLPRGFTMGSKNPQKDSLRWPVQPKIMLYRSPVKVFGAGKKKPLNRPLPVASCRLRVAHSLSPPDKPPRI